MVADQGEKGLYLFVSHAPVLHLDLQADLLNRVVELLQEELLLAVFVLLVERRGAGVAVTTASFDFEIGATTYPHDLLWVDNLRGFNVQIALRALLTQGQGTLDAESA